jgi:hypothetical protein
VGLDRGRRGSAADRFSDHRRLEQQPEHREHRLVTDGHDQRHSAKHDRLRLDLAEAGNASGPDGPGSTARWREIS